MVRRTTPRTVGGGFSARKLREALEERDMTALELQGHLLVAGIQADVQRYLAGRLCPSYRTAMALARILGKRAEDFMEDGEEAAA